jgi:adenosylmethionine-8-amino-7-oxononanoate aminotransferase
MRINVRTWSDQYCKRYFKLDLYSIITQFFPLFDWPCILTPNLVYPLTEENLAKAKLTEKMALGQIKDVIAKEGRDIAGLILEPIQGQGVITISGQSLFTRSGRFAAKMKSF